MSLFEEITKRRLLQTAALYIAVAWGGTEILAFLIESLLSADHAKVARRYLAILLIAGFPAAMYLAWTRDLGSRARRLFSAGVVSVLVVAVLVISIPKPPPPPTTAVENSIAIVPFDVCEDSVSERPLAGGLTREVFTRLAQRDRLKVRGRVSVRTVMESAPSEAVMAALLGVKYLLSGIVCRDGLDLTLHAQLTDDEGFVVWEEDYTQGVNQSDQVNQRLASLVDNGVAVRLGDVAASSTDSAVNRNAHEQLLIGHGHREQGDAEKARAAYENALALQPDYAEAVWALSWLEERRDEAKPIVERALQLAKAALERNSYDFKANKTAGLIVYNLGRLEDEQSYRDYKEIGEDGVLVAQARAQSYYAEAESYLRSALAINPAATEIRIRLVFAMDRQGIERRKESLGVVEQGLDLEPFNSDLTKLASHRLVEFGRLREAMDRIDRFEVLPQGKGELWAEQQEILQNQDRYDEKLAYLIELLRDNPEDMKVSYTLYHLWWTVAEIAMLGLFEEAETLHLMVEKIPNPEDKESWHWARQFFLVEMYLGATGHSEDVTENMPEEVAGMSDEEILEGWHLKAMDYAWAFWEAGDKDRALGLLEALQHYQVRTTIWAERQAWGPMNLAQLYLDMGLDEEARKVFGKVVELLQPQVDSGVRHPETLQRLAEAHYRLGNLDVALKLLHLSIDYGKFDLWLCCEDLLAEGNKDEFEPWATEIRDNPEVQLAQSRMRAIVEKQRSNIRALLAQNDMNALLAPLMTE